MCYQRESNGAPQLSRNLAESYCEALFILNFELAIPYSRSVEFATDICKGLMHPADEFVSLSGLLGTAFGSYRWYS